MKNKLTIAWFYPRLMSLYGDRGNIIALVKRCEWRNIETEVKFLDIGFDKDILKNCDIFFMGGAQDRQQKVVSSDLLNKKRVILDMINKNTPGLFICGAYQFMGEYYKEANGQKIEGLGIFDLYTESVQNAPRLIGNIAIETNLEDIGVLVGFENHGGRTSLGKSATPFGKVLSGFGNNGKDSTEGIIYKNSIGTYLHGPILPKNPGVADFLIEKALENIYQEKFTLKKLDDVLELTAKKAIAKRMSIDL